MVSLRRGAQSLSSVPFQRFISCYLPRTLPLPSWHQRFVLPPPPQVVSSQPYAGDCRGAAALRLLSVLQYSVHPALEQLWSKRVPSLVEHIEGRRGLQPLLGSPSSGLLLGFAASQEWSGVLPRTVGLGVLKLLEVVLPVLIGLLIALVPLIPTTSPCLGL